MYLNISFEFLLFQLIDAHLDFQIGAVFNLEDVRKCEAVVPEHGDGLSGRILLLVSSIILRQDDCFVNEDSDSGVLDLPREHLFADERNLEFVETGHLDLHALVVAALIEDVVFLAGVDAGVMDYHFVPAGVFL